jgi:hypothetical protein
VVGDEPAPKSNPEVNVTPESHTMNTRTLAAALALSLIGTAALAQDPSYEPLPPVTSAKSRAEVQAEALQARNASAAAITVAHAGADAWQDISEQALARVRAPSIVSRDNVRADTLAAARSGDLALQALKSYGADDRFAVAARATIAR